MDYCVTVLLVWRSQDDPEDVGMQSRVDPFLKSRSREEGVAVSVLLAQHRLFFTQTYTHRSHIQLCVVEENNGLIITGSTPIVVQRSRTHDELAPLFAFQPDALIFRHQSAEIDVPVRSLSGTPWSQPQQSKVFLHDFGLDPFD